MADPDRYKSLISRQKKKLAYARKLLPWLEEAAKDLDEGLLDSTSYNAVARWLTAKGVKPSENARDGARFAPQTLKDYLFMDGLEPTEDALWGSGLPRRGENQKGQKHRIREEGFRVSAMREFQKCEGYIAGEFGQARLARERAMLERHLADVESVAKGLRQALGL